MVRPRWRKLMRATRDPIGPPLQWRGIWCVRSPTIWCSGIRRTSSACCLAPSRPRQDTTARGRRPCGLNRSASPFIPKAVKSRSARARSAAASSPSLSRRRFARAYFGDDAAVTGATRSVDNILSPTIANLVAYARTAMVSDRRQRRVAHRVARLPRLHRSDAGHERACASARIAGSFRIAIRRDSSPISKRISASRSASLISPKPWICQSQRCGGSSSSTGRTLHQFIIERRLQYACKLLMKPDLAIPEIALASGFSSQQHMTMAFSNRLGTTPKSFQRANGGD